MCTYADSEDDIGAAIGTIDLGDLVTCGTESFYVMYGDDDTVTMFAKYNLYVGGQFTTSGWKAYGSEATGVQDSKMLGYVLSSEPYFGTTAFSNDGQKGTDYSSYDESVVEGYVNNYKMHLVNFFDLEILEARLITYDELITLGCGIVGNSCSGSLYHWVYSTSYWTESSYSTTEIWRVRSSGAFHHSAYNNNDSFGVRPVIRISKSNFSNL